MTEKAKYPIGQFKPSEAIDAGMIERWMTEIAAFPEQLKTAVAGWTDEQLNTPYREGGWTVRQLIHHVADSHMNSYIRFKWALTEDSPTIKAYDEKAWAELPEAKSAPVAISLDLLTALHTRWVMVLKNLSESDLKRYFVHPESGEQIPLDHNIALYAWHSRHHLHHVLQLKERKGW